MRSFLDLRRGCWVKSSSKKRDDHLLIRVMSSSFSVLNDVDEQTSKAILGSDGAARWQNFREGNKVKATSSAAPAIPLKRLDRVLGTKSISDERATEAKIRKDAGHRELGAGYTEFKRANDHEEIAAQKKRKQILERIRPDEIPYFLPAETFEGSKFDYVFTTKESRGTGYYWDGWDSMKRELGEGKPDSSNESDSMGTEVDPKFNRGKHNKGKKKGKKRKMMQETATVENDEWNPMEQIVQALQRKQAAHSYSIPLKTCEVSVGDAIALGASSSELKSAARNELAESTQVLPSGWESAKDPSSGKTYYFCRSTAERSWTKPFLNNSENNKSEDDKGLPEGWKLAKDPASSKLYYYHSDGRTSWIKPTSC